jgi:hypothetical protein
MKAILLSDDILRRCEIWRDQCKQRWAEGGRWNPIGQSTIVSPIDGAREVLLAIAPFAEAKGKTFVGIKSPSDGKTIGEGYTIVLNRAMLDPGTDPLLTILLHEIVHTVDPDFPSEQIERGMLDAKSGRRRTSEEQFALPSERRAFAAMWTARLRAEIAASRVVDPGDAVERYRRDLKEFDCFCRCYGPAVEEVAEQFREIIADLQRRPGAPAAPAAAGGSAARVI